MQRFYVNTAIFVLIMFIWSDPAIGQDYSVYKKFEQKNQSGDQIGYRLYAPEIEAGKQYPVILFLHGAGERGKDNEAQLIHVVHRFSDSAFQKKYPCYILVPQCPKKRYWSSGRFEDNWGRFIPDSTLNTEMQLTMDALEALIANQPIDTDRLYLSGLSMGGYGTWDLISRFPNKFAAAIPICGGGDPTSAHRFAQLPVWAFHGADDTVVPAELSRKMIQAMRDAGGNPIYTEFPNTGHDSWTDAFNEQPYVYDWLFSQRKGK